MFYYSMFKKNNLKISWYITIKNLTLLNVIFDKSNNKIVSKY